MSETPSGGGRRRWLRVPALGVVMLLLAGAGAYFAARGYEGGKASQSCGSYDSCIPRLEAASVVKALEGQGHTCTQDGNHQTCELHIGMARFRASLQVEDGLIPAMSVDIYRGIPVTETGLAYLNWFATLPYADDDETSVQIEEWLAEQVNGNKDTKASIGDYVYQLTNPETYAVVLEIKGNY